MRDVIPGRVFDEIKDHLTTVGNRAESGWEAGSEEEDTLTGHFGAQLETEWTMPIPVDGQRWQWRVKYKKFRGRGPHAFEKESGADGIVQVEVTRPDGVLVHKGILFQAKKGSVRRDPRLIEQIEKMEDLATNGSAVFEYQPEAYRAVSGREVLERLSPEATAEREPSQQLGSYLGEQFLPCETGVRGMYFDAVRKVLVVPTETGIRAVNIEIGHRIGIDVRGRRAG